MLHGLFLNSEMYLKSQKSPLSYRILNQFNLVHFYKPNLSKIQMQHYTPIYT
jgi:hypothetical protein